MPHKSCSSISSNLGLIAVLLVGASYLAWRLSVAPTVGIEWYEAAIRATPPTPCQPDGSVKPGQWWRYPAKVDPWGTRTFEPHLVVDVRDEWVRYKLYERDGSRDLIRSFTRIRECVDHGRPSREER